MAERSLEENSRQEEAVVNRKYKDNLFRMVFREKKELLSLYNALNHTDYQDPEELEITTVENVIYMGMKNDLSFLIDGRMNLYEAQSTPNANMPLRGLFYFAKVYQGYVAGRRLDIYGKGRVRLPFPNYVVFYNGEEKRPEEWILRLSDSFEGAADGGLICLECTARVLNINAGQNQELMESCRRLYEYAEFVRLVREKTHQYPDRIPYAVDQAIDESIRRGILKEFLIKHRAEVKAVCLTEYDEELHMETVRKEGWEEGWNDGHQAGRDEERRAAIQSLRNRMKVSEKEAREMLGISEE